MSEHQYIDHTETVAMIRKQNWKLGGALCVDGPEAEEAVYNILQEAAQVVHARCVAAAEDAANNGRNVVDAVRYTSTLV